MDRFGREALRWWRTTCPQAFDAFARPFAHFEHVDAHCKAVIERQAGEAAARRGDERDCRFWVEQRSQTLLEAMPMPPR